MKNKRYRLLAAGALAAILTLMPAMTALASESVVTTKGHTPVEEDEIYGEDDLEAPVSIDSS